MLLLYKNLYLTHDLQKREELNVKIILLEAELKGTTAVTQRKKIKVRISNLGCLVSLAQMRRKQEKS